MSDVYLTRSEHCSITRVFIFQRHYASLVLNVRGFAVPAMIVVLRRDVAIDELAELRAGNSGMARSTVGYMKHGEIRLVVSGGCIVIIMKDIKNHGDQLCPLLDRKEPASVVWDIKSCACYLDHLIVCTRIKWRLHSEIYGDSRWVPGLKDVDSRLWYN